jgi:hypothetical protein
MEKGIDMDKTIVSVVTVDVLATIEFTCCQLCGKQIPMNSKFYYFDMRFKVNGFWCEYVNGFAMVLCKKCKKKAMDNDFRVFRDFATYTALSLINKNATHR